ncbi:MAG: chromosome segregation protein SMC, partial [Abditibacteriota bacterium]|nr:chromosome segregation protein SMC [Abditibacteriota bacterium]
MYIKRIDLFGFKTFADKTVLDFGDGVTCVVGPNGSGKSNIADALLWVLGENNVRNLRATYNTDVIFSGTDKRRPLGFAEVTLTMDNSDRTLPIDYNEVAVTRRIYRSGDSEYTVNGTKYRLKDIYEMFLDTGIGRESYSFITQGEIDSVLSARPEERRELFEEAAGIKKYRYRRKEALKKLEKTKDNLSRVSDIISELNTQLGPLEKQAEEAKAYLAMQSRLREIETSILVRELKNAFASYTETVEERKKAQAEVAKTDAEAEDLRRQRNEKSGGITDLESRTESARNAAMSVNATVSDLRNKVALRQERVRSLESAVARLTAESAAAKARAEASGKLSEEVKGEQAKIKTSLAELTESLKTAEAELAEIDREYTEADKLIAGRREGYTELAGKAASISAALIASETKTESIKSRLASCKEDTAKAEGDAKAAAEKHESLTADLENNRKESERLTSERARLTEERKKIDGEAETLLREQGLAVSEKTAKVARLATLREMHDSREGFFEGVKNVTAAADRNELSGDFDPVADVIDVPAGYEIAMETALGASLQDVICETAADAKAAIAYLKKNRGGRATFLPLDSMRPKYAKETKAPGILGVASDIVKYEPYFAPAVESLLGTVLVAKTIDDAHSASRKLKGWNKIVTLEGEVIVPSGAMTGGTRRSEKAGLLTRKRETEDLAADIASLTKDIEGLESRIAEKRKESAAKTPEIAAAEKAIEGERVRGGELRSALEFALREKNRAEKNLEDLRKLAVSLTEAAKTEAAVCEKLRAESEEISRRNKDIAAKVEDAESRIRELTRKRDEKRDAVMRMRADKAGLDQRDLACDRRLDDIRRSVREYEDSSAAASREIESSRAEIETVKAKITSAESEIKRQTELLNAANAALAELGEKRVAENNQLKLFDDEIYRLGKAKNELSEREHALSLKETRLEMKYAAAAQRLADEYDISFDEAMERSTDDIERGDIGEVARIRKDMRAMGNVNLSAPEHYEQAAERKNFLAEQSEDLIEARNKLERSIEEIDRNTHGLFMKTFKELIVNFDKMFKRLFGGGETDIKLTDPDNLLETGIDIIVRVPGKKLQNMNLLSGGEKALTAMAFIFALLMRRPGPFVLMDEVDAPLDENNVNGVAEVIAEFANKSHFIVVTHKRMTMESADNL